MDALFLFLILLFAALLFGFVAICARLAPAPSSAAAPSLATSPSTAATLSTRQGKSA